MIEIVPVTLQHVLKLREEIPVFTEQKTDGEIEAMLRIGAGFSMIRDGKKVLCCGGVITQWSGVGLLWLAISNEMSEHPKLLFSHTCRMIDLMWKLGNFVRLHAYIDPTQKKHIRFIEALGFVCEGRMVKHAPGGGDHLLYALT